MKKSEWHNGATDEYYMIQYFKDCFGVIIVVIVNAKGYKTLTYNNMKDAKIEMERIEAELKNKGFKNI